MFAHMLYSGTTCVFLYLNRGREAHFEISLNGEKHKRKNYFRVIQDETQVA